MLRLAHCTAQLIFIVTKITKGRIFHRALNNIPAYLVTSMSNRDSLDDLHIAYKTGNKTKITTKELTFDTASIGASSNSGFTCSKSCVLLLLHVSGQCTTMYLGMLRLHSLAWAFHYGFILTNNNHLHFRDEVWKQFCLAVILYYDELTNHNTFSFVR